ncbi:hypothetical protein RJ640_012901 [Escallonia rubra]|uniref:HD-ZIP protein N-terminal domain-containing protein n=1 Tax=Escallonia rubra TaxID=112253 RepID=A0AA88R2H5_9ASTE|nr:hypothetical protein RJ640_012901 [Escallonia rubra]
MMAHGKEDLGLSLSLAFPENRSSQQQLNRMPSSLLSSSSSSSPSPFGLFQKAPWNEAFPSSDRNSEACRVETRSFLRGIDVNRLPSTADIDDEAGVSSPNSTISTVSGKRSERDANGLGDDPETERACSRGLSDDEDGDNSRKKLRLSKDQSAILEESFKEHNTLNPVRISAHNNTILLVLSALLVLLLYVRDLVNLTLAIRGVPIGLPIRGA